MAAGVLSPSAITIDGCARRAGGRGCLAAGRPRELARKRFLLESGARGVVLRRAISPGSRRHQRRAEGSALALPCAARVRQFRLGATCVRGLRPSARTARHCARSKPRRETAADARVFPPPAGPPYPTPAANPRHRRSGAAEDGRTPVTDAIAEGGMWNLLDPAFGNIYRRLAQAVVRQKLIDEVSSRSST